MSESKDEDTKKTQEPSEEKASSDADGTTIIAVTPMKDNADDAPKAEISAEKDSPEEKKEVKETTKKKTGKRHLQRGVAPGIDVQLEYVWTVVWSYLSAWSFGAPIVFPMNLPMWNGVSLFFLLCLGFPELQTGATTNPVYWVKDFFVDETSLRPLRKAPLERVFLMSLVDLFGHMTGFWLYLKTLEFMGERAAFEISANPPNFACNWIWAFIVEVIVTAGTQLSSTIPETIGLTGRVGSLVSNAISVYGLMVWGTPYTGASMNPASSLASTIVSSRMRKQEVVSVIVILKLIFVYISAPIAGAVVAGIVEGGIVRDQQRREKVD